MSRKSTQEAPVLREPGYVKGILEKKGSGGMKNWRFRWFVFSEETADFTYYLQKGDEQSSPGRKAEKPRGRVNVVEVFGLPDRESSSLRKNRFDVRCSTGRILCLAAPSAKRKTEWLEAFSKVLGALRARHAL